MPPDPGEGLNRIDLLVMNLSDQNQVPDIHNPELKTSFMRCIGKSYYFYCSSFVFFLFFFVVQDYKNSFYWRESYTISWKKKLK